jgi:hypothetical protein
MSDTISKNPLVQTITNGLAKPDLLDYLMHRQLPFTEEEYLESFVFLLRNDQLKSQAEEHLRAIPRSVKVAYVQKRDASHRVAYQIILESLDEREPEALVHVVQNNALPTEFLMKIAEQGPLPALESLLENQVQLIAYPELLNCMERNPELTPFISGKIKEIRDFYLKGGPAEEIPSEQVVGDVVEAIVQADGRGADGNEQDILELQQETLTTLQRINRMSVAERIKLAISGTRTERLILIKDANKMVQQAVIESPKVSDDEVMIHVRDLSLAGEVIAKIASSRDWTKNYNIMLGLVQHPKTPINRALAFIKQLHSRDLKLISQDKNISPVIRQLAINFVREKERVRS